jgi:hypothetical protein
MQQRNIRKEFRRMETHDNHTNDVFLDHFIFSSGYLRHKTTLFSESWFKSKSIPIRKIVQKQGEFIVTFPRGYHFGFNTGFNVAESTNFASPRWVDYGIGCQHCTCPSTADSLNEIPPSSIYFSMDTFHKHRPEWIDECPASDIRTTSAHNRKVTTIPSSSIKPSDGGERSSLSSILPSDEGTSDDGAQCFGAITRDFASVKPSQQFVRHLAGDVMDKEVYALLEKLRGKLIISFRVIDVLPYVWCIAYSSYYTCF